jgi:hypothetical protein
MGCGPAVRMLLRALVRMTLRRPVRVDMNARIMVVGSGSAALVSEAVERRRGTHESECCRGNDKAHRVEGGKGGRRNSATSPGQRRQYVLGRLANLSRVRGSSPFLQLSSSDLVRPSPIFRKSAALLADQRGKSARARRACGNECERHAGALAIESEKLANSDPQDAKSIATGSDGVSDMPWLPRRLSTQIPSTSTGEASP